MALMSITTQNNSGTLPNDVLFAILTSVDLDDLPACRQVSHEFYKMTNETTFKPQHCVKTNTVSGYLIQREQYNWPNDTCYYSFVSDYPVKCPIDSLSVLKQYNTTIEAVSQCRGLICCFDAKFGKEQYYVCKPATGQCKAIPNPNLRYQTVATAMVASSVGPVDLKIIRFSTPYNNNMQTSCEIFDSRSWTWRRSKDIKKYIYFPGHGLGRPTRPVFSCGSVHWLITDNKHETYIFAFDVEKETWKLICVPARHMDFEKRWHSKITVRSGKLCYVMLKDAEEMIVWTMERYKAKLWWRKEAVRLKEAEKSKDGWLELYMEFIYCSKIRSYDCFFAELWEKFWKAKLNKHGINEFFVGEAFKIESDFTHCECLK